VSGGLTRTITPTQVATVSLSPDVNGVAVFKSFIQRNAYALSNGHALALTGNLIVVDANIDSGAHVVVDVNCQYDRDSERIP